MSNNRINAMYESGTPLGTRIAHKHGWIDDTHGDAGVVFTPGGDFVMVTIVHNPQWMDYGESFPLIAELARATYNYYNPDAPVAEIRPGEGAEQCELLGNPLIADLMSPRFEG
jgi:beta-lactamase class A